MARKPAKEDKVRLSRWLVNMKLSLEAIQSELEMDRLMSDDMIDALKRIDMGLEMLRRQLEIE